MLLINNKLCKSIIFYTHKKFIDSTLVDLQEKLY